jgi:hypothetical protein
MKRKGSQKQGRKDGKKARPPHHPKSPFFTSPPDFALLATKYPTFEAW